MLEPRSDMPSEKVQHILFSGHIGANSAGCVDVRDVVSGEPVPFEDANGVLLSD